MLQFVGDYEQVEYLNDAGLLPLLLEQVSTESSSEPVTATDSGSSCISSSSSSSPETKDTQEEKESKTRSNQLLLEEPALVQEIITTDDDAVVVKDSDTPQQQQQLLQDNNETILEEQIPPLVVERVENIACDNLHDKFRIDANVALKPPAVLQEYKEIPKEETNQPPELRKLQESPSAVQKAGPPKEVVVKTNILVDSNERRLVPSCLLLVGILMVAIAVAWHLLDGKSALLPMILFA